jgi:hypothetical protein
MSIVVSRGSSKMSVLFLPIYVPGYLVPFCNAIVMALLVPNSSFIGHMSGTLTGILVHALVLTQLSRRNCWFNIWRCIYRS